MNRKQRLQLEADRIQQELAALEQLPPEPSWANTDDFVVLALRRQYPSTDEWYHYSIVGWWNDREENWRWSTSGGATGGAGTAKNLTWDDLMLWIVNAPGNWELWAAIDFELIGQETDYKNQYDRVGIKPRKKVAR